MTLLGNLLVEDEIITNEKLNEAIRIQREEGGMLGIILLNLGYLNENTLTAYLYKQVYLERKYEQT